MNTPNHLVAPMITGKRMTYETVHFASLIATCLALEPSRLSRISLCLWQTLRWYIFENIVTVQ